MRISVALCTFNGEKFIVDQIDSILNQTLKVDEIIVCDDGSSDKTIEILKDYQSKFLGLFKIFRNEINLRSVKNFEKAISLCTGDIIFLADQDDVWIDIKVEKMIDYFNKNQKIDVLATNGYCIDEKSVVQEKYAVWDVPEFLRKQNIEVDYFKIMSYAGNIATGASMAFRKSIVQDFLPFPIIKNFHHDEWIAIISSYTNSFELLNDKLFYYRTHKNQQVGGVFYNKTLSNKKKLSVDFCAPKICFESLKKQITKINNALILNNVVQQIYKYESTATNNIILLEKYSNANKRLLYKINMLFVYCNNFCSY